MSALKKIDVDLIMNKFTFYEFRLIAREQIVKRTKLVIYQCY